MSNQNNEQRKADELLQQLQAVYLNGENKSGENPDLAEKPSAPDATPETATEAPQKRSVAPAVILTLTENDPSSQEPEPTESDRSEPIQKTPKALRSDAQRDSQGTTMPKKTTLNPFLIQSDAETSEKTSDTESAAQSMPAPRPKTRPNTTKVPPRKRSGPQTGAIRPKNASAANADIPAASKPRPVAPKSAPRALKVEPIVAKPDPEPLPRKESPKKEVPVSKSAVSAPPRSAKEEKTIAQTIAEEPLGYELAESVSESRADSDVNADIENLKKPVKSTVEPIENAEAAETVNESSRKRASLRRAKKNRKSEENLDATAIIAKRTGLDESDIALIFELGYENELGRLVGYETLKKLKYEHLRSSRADTSDYYEQAYGYRGKEYTSATPREQVLAAYLHDRRSLFLRVALLAFLAVVLFIVDFPALFGGAFLAYAQKLPYLFPAFGFVLFGVSVFLTKDRILGGWRAFLRFAPSPYSTVAVAVPLMLIYSVASLITARKGILVPMNLATELALLFLSLCDVIRITDEIRTFRVVSETGEKTVLEEMEPRKKKLRQGNRTVKILNDEAGKSLYRVRPTQEIVGFFRRVNDLFAASRPFTYLTVFWLVCAVAGGLAVSLVLNDALRGILATAATLMFSIPVSATFLFFDPLRRANRHLVSRRSILVGEGSVNEYSPQKTVIFNDTETFRAKRQAQIVLRDGDDFRRDMRLAGILFRKLGGTLSNVGKIAPGKEEGDSTVNLVRLTETGVEAVVENRFRLLAGDTAFLTNSGVKVPKESTDRAAIRSRGVNILYVAVNGTLKLTYEVAYTISPSFRDVITLLARTETTLAVQSYDPNLNDAFLRIGFADGDDVVHIIKPAQFELPTPAEITDTGVVTLDGPLGAAYPLRAASLIVRARRAGFAALFGSILPGAVLAFFASRNLPVSSLPFLPLMALGYRALWLGISWLISALSLSRRAVFDDTRENLANENQSS